MLAARRLTRQAIDEIARRVKPGMIEDDAVAMAKDFIGIHGLPAT